MFVKKFVIPYSLCYNYLFVFMLNSSETLSEKFVKKGFWLYFFSFIWAPIWYILKIIFSYNLSIEELWVLYWVISLVGLFIVYHDLGLTESLNFFLPKYIVKKDWKSVKSLMSYALIGQISTSIIIFSVLYFGSDFIATHYFHTPIAKPVLQIFSFFFLGMNAFQMTNTFFWAVQNTKSQKGTEFLRMISSLAATLVFWRFWYGTIENYAWTWVIWLIVGIIYSLFTFYKNYYIPYLSQVKAVFEKPLIKQVMWYAFWVLMASNIGSVLWQIDMQLVIYILGGKEAGYYTNYLSIIGMPFLFVTPIIAFMFPVISELFWRGDLTKITMLKNVFYKYFSIIAIAISVFFFVFWTELAIVLFWSNFSTSGEILKYSAFFLIFNLLLQINFQILGGIGQARGRVKILGIGFVFNLVLNLILIKYFWSRWSSLAVGISWIPIWWMSLRAIKQFPLAFDWKFLGKNIIWIALLWGAFFWIKQIYPILNLKTIYVFWILIWVILLFAWFFAVINFSEWKRFIWEILSIMKKWKQKGESAVEIMENSTAE